MWFLGFFLLMIISFFFDQEISDFILNLRTGSLELFMVSVSSMVFLALVILACIYLLKDRKKIIYFLLGGGVSYAISLGLKHLIKIPRPNGIEGFGFPSSHVSVYFFIFAFMMGQNEKNWKYFLLIAIIIGISRLYLGVHYLSDVIGGALLGFGLYLAGRKWLKI